MTLVGLTYTMQAKSGKRGCLGKIHSQLDLSLGGTVLTYAIYERKVSNMTICHLCHQPITNGSSFKSGPSGKFHHSTEVQGYNGAGGLGCPLDSQIIANLEVAMSQGFKPEFCRTHYKFYSDS